MAEVNKYACIMAGGLGKRFWPLSRRNRPKHLIPVVGETSLLRQTAERLASHVGWSGIVVVTNAAQFHAVREELPELDEGRILAEPCGRNTAACIGLCLRWIMGQDTGETLVGFFPSDHLIPDRSGFTACLSRAWEVAQSGNVITFGIRPSRPETGYGYIEAGDPLPGFNDGDICHVRGFFEKPNLETAKEWVRNGQFLWNSGMFVAKIRVLWQEIERFLPLLAQGLVDLGDDFSYNGLQDKSVQYGRLPRISIDCGVMEKSDLLALVKADFSWDDLGSWEAASGYWPEVGNGNRAVGEEVALIECEGCRISADGMLVALVGLKDVVVIQTDDALLVCPRERTQDVKRLVDQLELEEKDRYL